MTDRLSQWKADMNELTEGKPVLGKYYVLNGNLYIWDTSEVERDDKKVLLNHWHRLTSIELLMKYHEDMSWYKDIEPKTWLESFAHRGAVKVKRISNPHVDE